MPGLKAGHSYFGDGRSHIFNFAVTNQGAEAFEGDQVALQKPGTVEVTAQVCARLVPEINERVKKIREASPYTWPYWHLERARIGSSLKVPVEIVLNGMPVQSAKVEADGALHLVEFNAPIQKSSWLALRILPSSHTNPAFVVLNGSPVRASRKSAEWCRKAVDASWKIRASRIRATEREEAQAAFEHAGSTYDRIASECYT